MSDGNIWEFSAGDLKAAHVNAGQADVPIDGETCEKLVTDNMVHFGMPLKNVLSWWERPSVFLPNQETPRDELERGNYEGVLGAMNALIDGTYA